MIILSDIVNGHRVQMKYIGYSKTEAERKFKQYIKQTICKQQKKC